MNKRTLLLLTLVALLLFALLIPLIFLLRHNIPHNVTDLWTQPANQTNIVLGIVSSLICTALLGVTTYSWKRISRWIKPLVLPQRSLKDEKQKIDQERYYLENLIRGLEGDFHWEVKKYTELAAIQQEVTQTAYLIRPRSWGQTPIQDTLINENSRGPRINVSHFLQAEKMPIMLKGEPGTGKTLTVRRFAVEQARQSLKNLPAEVPLPVYIFLGEYTGTTEEGEPEPVVDFMQLYLHQKYHGATFLHEHLEEYLWEGRLIIIFDGLNEMPFVKYDARSKCLEQFASDYPKTKFIFTCRTLRDTRSFYKTITLSDLDNEQIKHFITSYLTKQPEHANEIYREVISADSGLLHIYRNPFVLHMLMGLGFKDQQIAFPHSLAELFERYVHLQLSNSTSSVEQIIRLLTDIAYAMQLNGIFAGTVSYEWLQKHLSAISTNNAISLDDALQEAQKAQLVDYIPTKNFRFYHQILQEYFAASALRDEWENHKDLSKYVRNYRWQETLLLCTSIAKDTEEFIHNIWSVGEESSESFWLALKAVGSCGGRQRISQAYFDALLQEARKKLGLLENTNTSGYPRTVLVVDTIKALSYIEDDRVVRLLCKAFKRHDGWFRELCIQSLGNSHNPYAHEQLSEAVRELYSFSELFRVAPYFERREWIRIVVQSMFSLNVWINAFWFLWRWLRYLLPTFFFGVLIAVAGFFRVDPIVFIGRIVALSLVISLGSAHIKSLRVIVRAEEDLRTKLIWLRDEFSLGDAVLLTLALVTWFFAGEALSLVAILLYVAACIFFWILIGLFVRNLKSLSREAAFLYSPQYGRVAMGITFFGIAILLLTVFYPSTQHVPSNAEIHHTGTVLETIFTDIAAIPYIAVLLAIPFIMIIGLLSIIVHIITYLSYWRLRNARLAYMRKGNTSALRYIMDEALNPHNWLQIRKRAIKIIRLIEVSSHDMEQLEEAVESESDSGLLSELERTVYELYSRVREQVRGIPDITLSTEEGRRQEALAIARQAESYYQEENYQEALNEFNHALAVDDRCVLALVKRGEMLIELKKYEDALKDFETAIAINGRNVRALYNRGKLYKILGSYQEALDDLNKVVSLDPRKFSSRAERGITYRNLKDYQKSLMDFNRAIKLNDKLGWIYQERAKTYSQMRQYGKALKDFRHSISLDKNNSSSYALRAMLYQRMGRYRHAVKDINQAISLEGTNPWLLYIKAQNQLLLGKIALAQETIQKAIAIAQDIIQSDSENALRWSFRIALLMLTSSDTTTAERQYTQLASTCSQPDELQIAITDLDELLASVKLFNEPIEHIISLLQARLLDLQRVKASDPTNIISDPSSIKN